MNKKHVEFLNRDFAIFHYSESKEQLYNKIKDKVETHRQGVSNKSNKRNLVSNRSKNNSPDMSKVGGIGLYGPFWKFIENANPVYTVEMFKESANEFELKQNSENNNESIAVIGKAFDIIKVHTSNGIIKYNFDTSYFRDLSVVWFDIDFSTNIDKIVIHFKHDILEPMEVSIKLITYQEIENEKREKQRKLDEIIPDIKHKWAVGDSLVNIKFNHVYEDRAIKTKIDLYDNEKDHLGTFSPEEGMKYLSIKDLAYGKYYYVIRQLDENDSEIQSTQLTEFMLKQPNYNTKPLR